MPAWNIRPKQLAQARENSTNAVSIYVPPVGIIYAEIGLILICNTSGAEALVRLFLDDDGTTYSEATALLWDVPIPGGDVLELNYELYMANLSGHLAYRSSVANALTITVFGNEVLRSTV